MPTDPFAWDDVDAGERYALYLDLGYTDPDNPTGPYIPQDLTGDTVVFVVESTAEGAETIRIVAGVTNPAGALVVEDATGGIVHLTLTPDTTRVLGKASWALWTNPDTQDADAVAKGTIKVQKVVDGRA
ncbi:hypothetical protein ACIBSV_46830 [Embleya sp. NPDC050154]|uniref:hypothetical protein n=1 Tax=Embleya sp. NPDC050154 TaxID=3363988 RepID=UPI0037B59E4C